LFLNVLSKSWWTSEEHERKIRNEFVHYILRPRLGSIESGYNIPTTRELKRIFSVYDFLIEHVYEIYGIIEDDGTSQMFLTNNEKLLISKDNESSEKEENVSEKTTKKGKNEDSEIKFRTFNLQNPKPMSARVFNTKPLGKSNTNLDNDKDEQIKKIKGKNQINKRNIKEEKK